MIFVLFFSLLFLFWSEKDALVLCKIFQKSGSGPKTGEQYGAPFVEEEWEDYELVMVPGKKVADEVAFGDDAYLDGNDLEQVSCLIALFSLIFMHSIDL